MPKLFNFSFGKKESAYKPTALEFKVKCPNPKCGHINELGVDCVICGEKLKVKETKVEPEPSKVEDLGADVEFTDPEVVEETKVELVVEPPKVFASDEANELLEEAKELADEAALLAGANKTKLEKLAEEQKQEETTIKEAEIATNLIEKAFVKLEQVTIEGEAKIAKAVEELAQAKDDAAKAKLAMKAKLDEIRARRHKLENKSIEIQIEDSEPNRVSKYIEISGENEAKTPEPKTLEEKATAYVFGENYSSIDDFLASLN